MRLLSVPAVQLETRRIWELTRVREIPQALRQAMEKRQTISRETDLVGPPTKTLSLAASPLRDGEDIVGAVVVIHDITRLRQLESMRRDFVANVSHELKTPITVIQGSAEVLNEDPDMDTKFRTRFLDKIQNQVQRLNSLVNDLLTLARIEAEGIESQPQSVDFGGLLTSSVNAMTPVKGKPALTVTTDFPQQPVRMFCDAESLRQIADNLLNNALKYTPDGGRVHVSLLEAESSIIFEVEDTGPGIEPAHLDRIFERFYRVDSARTREEGGTGLGLAIVKHLCGSLGGDIQVRSAPGQGSVFTAVLPKIAPGARAEEARLT